jgi:hypothetical protein
MEFMSAKSNRARLSAVPDHGRVDPELEAQERALTWAASQGAPILVLDGWDPDTGTWEEGSPIAAMLDTMRRSAAPPALAAKLHGVRGIDELVHKGRDLFANPNTSEDRRLVPIEVRPFLDLARQVDRVEAEVEIEVIRFIYEAASQDPKLSLRFLEKRFPQRWSGRHVPTVTVEPTMTVERDRRWRAIDRVMEDPEVADQLAQMARWVNDPESS